MNCIILLLLCLTLTRANMTDSTTKLFQRVYSHCFPKPEVLKCLKIQTLKIVDRAVHSKALKLFTGVALVSDQGKTLSSPLTRVQLEKVTDEEVNALIVDATARFLDTHRLQVDVTKFAEEGRGKGGGGGGKKGSNVALYWALAIKGTFLAMAYNGIAVMSGTAIVVGKIALLLSAILGLKKLVHGDKEKTTLEITLPKHSEGHSHEDEYHRSINVGKHHQLISR